MSRQEWYVASRTRHAPMWKALKNAGWPIMSSWIYEAMPGETMDFGQLWDRNITEASHASALLLYITEGDPVKGALVELGAALTADVPVICVGMPEEWSLYKSGKIRIARDLVQAYDMMFDPRPTYVFNPDDIPF